MFYRHVIYNSELGFVSFFHSLFRNVLFFLFCGVAAIFLLSFLSMLFHSRRWPFNRFWNEPITCPYYSMYTWKMMYFPSPFPFLYTKVNTLSLPNVVTSLVNSLTAYKRLWRLCGLAGTSDSKNPELYYSDFGITQP